MFGVIWDVKLREWSGSVKRWCPGVIFEDGKRFGLSESALDVASESRRQYLSRMGRGSGGGVGSRSDRSSSLKSVSILSSQPASPARPAAFESQVSMYGPQLLS